MFNKNFTSFTIHFTHKFSSQFFHPVFTPFFCTFSTLFTKSALGPLWSSSRNVRIIIYLSVPSQRFFFQASYWPSDHMISSRPLIGNPPPIFSFFFKFAKHLKHISHVACSCHMSVITWVDLEQNCFD